MNKRKMGPPSNGINIFTDGACIKNPGGAGGWAFCVLRDGQEIHNRSGAVARTTNNRMELAAVIAALEWLIEAKPEGNVQLHTDSTYCSRGANEWRLKWKRKNWRKGEAPIPNADLWQILDKRLSEYPISLNWVRGHSGIVGNVRADKLAAAAINGLLAAEQSQMREAS